MRIMKKQTTLNILVFLILLLQTTTQSVLGQQTPTTKETALPNYVTIKSNTNMTYISIFSEQNITALEVLVLSPKNTTYPDTDIVFSCQFTEEVTNINYILDEQEKLTFTRDIILTDLSPGTHQLIVYAQDQNGTIKASEITIFTIKPHPSTLVVVSLSLVGIVGLILIINATKKDRKRGISELTAPINS